MSVMLLSSYVLACMACSTIANRYDVLFCLLESHDNGISNHSDGIDSGYGKSNVKLHICDAVSDYDSENTV